MYILRFIIFVFIFLSTHSIAALKSDLRTILKERDFYTRTNLEYLLEGHTVANSDVETYKGELNGEKDSKKQKMLTKVAAFHSLDCNPVLKKLSQYERYDSYFDFIKNSKYQNGHATMNLNISLISVNFDIDMKIDRVNKVGKYDFILNAGDMKNVIGFLEVKELRGRCFVYTSMTYDGVHSGYWDSFMETFFTKVAYLGVDKIFKISGHRAK